MERHPIGNMMQTALENIKDMVDVNTVVGDAIQTPEGGTVIPVSRVCFGFVAGGGEYGQDEQKSDQQSDTPYPFAGGSGAGVSVQPVGFLVATPEGFRLLPAQNIAPWERAVGALPQLVRDIKDIFYKQGEETAAREQQ